MKKNTTLALVSQALVSGTNFATSIIIGNACGADGLGVYFLGFSVIVFGIGVQSALVSTPYTVFYPTESPASRNHRAGSSLYNHMRALMAFGLLILPGSLLLLVLGATREALIGICLLFVLPAATSRDFSRRICFSDADLGSAVRIDGGVTGIQVLLLLTLWAFGILTPETGIICIGIACSVLTLWFYSRQRHRFELEPERLRTDTRKDWQFGKWLLLEQVFTIASTYMMPWVLALYLDSLAVGIFAACFSIASLSNPFLQGIGNYLLPVFSRHVSERDQKTLNQVNLRFTLLTVGVMVLYFLVCLAGGELLLQLLFRRDDYSGFGLLVAILAGRAVIGSAGLTAHYYLLARERPKVSLLASVLAVSTMVVASTWLIPNYGLYGAAFAWLGGTFVESLVMILGFSKLKPLQKIVSDP